VKALEEITCATVSAVAPLYESEPWGVLNQKEFLNTAILLTTPLEPGELLKVIKATERELGRLERGRWGPREIDIDILFYDNITCFTSELTIPHSRLLQRSFSFFPALKLCPGWVHPVTGHSLAQMALNLTFETKSIKISENWID